MKDPDNPIFKVPSSVPVTIKQDGGKFLGANCCMVTAKNHGIFVLGDWTSFKGGDNVGIVAGMFSKVEVGSYSVANLGQGSSFKGQEGSIVKLNVGHLQKAFHVGQMPDVKANTWYRLSPEDRQTLEEIIK